MKIFTELSEQAQDLAVSQYMELTNTSEEQAKEDLTDDKEAIFTDFGSYAGHKLEPNDKF